MFLVLVNVVENCGFIFVFCDVDLVSWVFILEIVKVVLGYLDFDVVLLVVVLGRLFFVGEWSWFFVEIKILVLIDVVLVLGM